MTDDTTPLSLETVLNEIKKIQQQNNNIVTQNNDIKKEISVIHKNFDDMSKDVAKCKEDINTLMKKYNAQIIELDNHKKQQDNILNSHTEMNTQIRNMNEKIKLLEKRLLSETLTRNQNENHSRKINVEISGVPITDNENCKDIVAKISKLMGLEFKSNEIDVAHRLFKKDHMHIPNIIARFFSRSERD